MSAFPSRRLIGVAGLLLVGACGGTTHDSLTSTATATPNVLRDAARAYLAAATTIDAAGASLYKRCETVSSLVQVQSCWSAAEAIDRSFLTKIFLVDYPPAMKSDVDAQFAAETKLVADEAQLASNPDDLIAAAAVTTDRDAETADANIVRHDLGLAPSGDGTP